MPLSEHHLVHLADVVQRRSGMALPPGKAELVESKLKPVATRFGFKAVAALLRELEDEPEELARAVTEAMTVNETSFFRDPAAFEFLRSDIVPALMAARAEHKRLRIWCAAAATGQEPYSLAMLLDEAGLYDAGWKIDLFATDLSREALRRLHVGVYSDYEIERGLPEALRERYLVADSDGWRIADRLRRRLRVQRFNLLDSFGWLGTLDLILCRNALFYFSDEARLDTLLRLERALAPDGWLLLGATETSDLAGLFVSAGEARGIFAKKPNWPQRRKG